jgi:hypothetical protein
MVFDGRDRREMQEAVDSLTQAAWLAVEESIAWDKATSPWFAGGPEDWYCDHSYWHGVACPECDRQHWFVAA